MKKTISSMLCAVMILSLMLSLTACGISGTYALKKISYGGVTVDAETAGFDSSAYLLEMSSDGTAILHYDGGSQQMQWKDNTLWATDQENTKVTFHVEGDDLSFKIDGIKMTFTKK